MEPLANKIRPTSLDNFVGQEHLVGKGKPLKQAIETRHLFSFLLWGPPGVGKTTLARIYARAVNAEYHELSAESRATMKILLDGLTLILEEIKQPYFLDLKALSITYYLKHLKDFLEAHIAKKMRGIF